MIVLRKKLYSFSNRKKTINIDDPATRRVVYDDWGLSKDYIPKYRWYQDTYHSNLYYHKPSGQWVSFDGDNLSYDSSKNLIDPIKNGDVTFYKSPRDWEKHEENFYGGVERAELQAPQIKGNIDKKYSPSQKIGLLDLFTRSGRDKLRNYRQP